MKKNELIFESGFLAAPDALEGEKNIRQSVRYLMDALWRSKDLTKAQRLIEQHLELLETHELMVRNVRSLFERRQPVDVERLNLLLKVGYRFKNQNMTVDDWQWIAESAETEALRFWALMNLMPKDNQPIAIERINPTTLEKFAALLENADEKIPEEISIQVAAMMFQIKGVTQVSDRIAQEIKASIELEENPLIRFPLAVAYVRDAGVKGAGEKDEPLWTVALEVLQDGIQNEDLNNEWKTEAKKLLKKHRVKCEELLKAKKV